MSDKKKKKDKKKSPLSVLPTSWVWTEEDAKRVRDELEKRKQDEFDKEMLRGKYDPKNIKRGVCIFCHGDVVAKVIRRQVPEPMKFGGKINFYHSHEGFYCKTCGLKYEFPPTENTYNQVHGDPDVADGNEAP